MPTRTPQEENEILDKIIDLVKKFEEVRKNRNDYNSEMEEELRKQMCDIAKGIYVRTGWYEYGKPPQKPKEYRIYLDADGLWIKGYIDDNGNAGTAYAYRFENGQVEGDPSYNIRFRSHFKWFANIVLCGYHDVGFSH